MREVSPPAGVAIYARRRLVRDCLAHCVAACPNLYVAGPVGDREELIRLAVLAPPDLILADAGGQVGATLSVLAEPLRRLPGVRVVMVYDAVSPGELDGAHQGGVDALVPGSHGLAALMLVLVRNAELSRQRQGPGPSTTGLSGREQEILALIGAGHPVRRIADLLGSSTHTVENSRRRIYAKLGPVRPADPLAGPLPDLSVREADMLLAISRGRTVRQTARELQIAEKTVENTRARLFLKLGAHNVTAAIAIAHDLGLLDLLAEEPPTAGPTRGR